MAFLELLDNVPETVVMGGHSLGGAMAARFALRNSDNLSGLVLMAAFSAEADNLSNLPLATLVLAAENDALATLDEVQGGMNRLPTDSTLELIPGAVHSFFGRYGSQQGDGIPTVSRETAEAAIIEVLSNYFETLTP